MLEKRLCIVAQGIERNKINKVEIPHLPASVYQKGEISTIHPG